MQQILQLLKQEGYPCVDESFYSKIAEWFTWYRGKVLEFHTYRQYNGKSMITRQRKSMGMAKTVAEDWANLCLNEKVEIVIDGEAEGTPVHEVLKKNNFRVRGNQLVELAFALGTGAIIEYFSGDDIAMDYVRAGMIFPLKWDNGEIIECAFGSERTIGKERFIYLNIHKKDGNTYVIQNKMFKKLNEAGESTDATVQVDLPEGMIDEIRTNSEIPLFQIIKPNIVNNFNPDIPLGLSVYANAIDQLKGLDLVYDSYINEFMLGKKRIIIPLSMARMIMEEDGSSTPLFDVNDTEFYAMPLGDDKKIEEINMSLRHESHEAGLKTALNLLSLKCGMGNNRYSFEHGTAKTATEVISEKSELYQSLKKHELILEKALIDMVYAIAGMLGVSVNEVKINFDDSIIEDETKKRLNDLQDVNAGILNRWEYRMEHYGEDEETAKQMADEANGEGNTLDMFGGA